MGGDRRQRGGCDPEEIFELVEGELAPGREREVRDHLEGCPGCRRLYERELNVSAFLGSMEISEVRTCSVSRGVAMALPTRSAKVRLLWGVSALGLLFMALFALTRSEMNPFILLADVLGYFWGLAAGFEDLIYTIFTVVGPTFLFALAFGALLDVLIAAMVLSASRRARRA